uniref:Uncharacterized protein n=1 Tax=Candidatus Kentrum sp. LPFa TaxID=2126335 RepID=A0A450X762_9GAMM|nr:MAG: hypothetical protein BECKLPF1236A_GA0070988_1001820 [Candidatus Kentron sp. LPFa]VFK25149.1 MAG: hypothetical protein BECKLPF1236C_GA0070990_1001913 [Candidatus Kentron sp. LPFa]
MKNTAFDHEKFREKVEERLRALHNPRFFAAFAAHVALATLPMLADRIKVNPIWKI